jgi:hypothetical protein
MDTVIVSTENAFAPALIRRLNTWYSINDGNWSDPNTWVSNALDKKNVVSPRIGDTVYILHNVNLDVSATLNNLYIQTKLYSTVNGLTLTINGDLQANGIIDFTANSTTIVLYGYNNFINSFIPGNSSTITYARIGSQNVMPLSYFNVNILGTGTKYLTANTVLNGALVVNGFNASATSILECSTFDLTVGGTTNVTYGSSVTNNNLSKSSSGNLTFIGLFTYIGDATFNSNVNVEFRGGISLQYFNAIIFNSPVNFTTNSQSITNSGGTFNGAITITGAITLTNNTGSPTLVNGTLNGTVSGSTLNNDGILYLGSTNVPMVTGVWNYQHGANSTLGYNFNGNYTIPYTSYANLVINGTGIKTLSGNTTTSKGLVTNSLAHDGNLECGGFDLTVTTTFLNQGSLKASTFCNILFIGNANFSNGNNTGVGVDLRTGNPNVEFRGGLSILAYINYTGTGTWKFSTNNQTLAFQNIIGGSWDAAILVSGITLTYSGGGTSMAGAPINSTINAVNSTDIFNNTGVLVYMNATAPMVTGKLYCNQSANTWIYGALANQDIKVPSDPTPGYKNLTLQGSGAKKLLGNVSVKGIYTLTAPATLNSNGFALTNP